MKIFICLLLIASGGFSQTLEEFSKIDFVDFVRMGLKYYYTGPPKSFCIYDGNIYYPSDKDYLMEWKACSKESDKEVKLLSKRHWTELKRSKNYIVEVDGKTYNLMTHQILREPFMRKYGSFATEQSVYTVFDTTVYLIISGVRSLGYKYYVLTKKLDTGEKNIIKLEHLLNYLAENHCHLDDLYIDSGIMYLSYSSYSVGDSLVLVTAWNIFEDKPQFPLFEITNTYIVSKIIGMDPLGLWLMSTSNTLGSSKMNLLILTQDFKIIKHLNINDVYRDFMGQKRYTLHLGEKDMDNPFFFAQNERKELFLMVKTQKAIHFYRFDYLDVLKPYFSNLTSVELRRYRNTIFARYGRKFKDRKLQNYFENQYWYRPDPNYSDSLLTEYDLRCIEFIKGIEKSKMRNAK